MKSNCERIKSKILMLPYIREYARTIPMHVFDQSENEHILKID